MPEGKRATKETLPRTQRVAVLFNPDNSVNERNLPAMEQTAKLLKIGLQRFEVRELASSRMPFQK